MDSALCTLNNRVYDAAEFARLNPTYLESRRRALICNSCGHEAFFRSASVSGRGPCFGARPHGPDCPEATVDAGVWGVGGAEQNEPIFNAADRIVIDLPAADGERVDNDVGGAEHRRRGAGRGFGAEGGAGVNATHRRLSSLLRRLNQNPEFQSMDTIITPPGGYAQTTVRDFFVRFESAREKAIGQFSGLWGMITDASYDQGGSLWLNTGGRSQISFVIDQPLVNAFLLRLRVDNIEALSGAQALILATASESGRGKIFASIGDLRFAAFSLA